MNTYEHSVSIDVSRCTGCTMGLKRCPTEAIRIKDGHAVINPDRCIDCGVCIRYCPNNAKKSICNSFEEIKNYKYRIVLPAPALMAQFDNLDNIGYVIQGLLDIGFDEVFEVAKAAELVSCYTRLYLQTEGVRRPVISTACPVVARLIVLRFPFLKDNLLPLLPPMEVAAALAREAPEASKPTRRYWPEPAKISRAIMAAQRTL